MSKTAPIRRFPRTCLACRAKQVNPATIDETVEMKYDGAMHTVAVTGIPVEQCGACGEMTYGTDSEAVIHAALRKQLGLLAPEEIRACRAALNNLKQGELAAATGMAAESISRWESGTVMQSRATDRLLRAYFGVPQVRELFAALDRGEKPALVAQDASLFVASEVDWFGNPAAFTPTAHPQWLPSQRQSIPSPLPQTDSQGSPFPRFVRDDQPKAA